MDLIKAIASIKLTLLYTAFLLVLGVAPALGQSDPTAYQEITYFCGIVNGEHVGWIKLVFSDLSWT